MMLYSDISKVVYPIARVEANTFFLLGTCFLSNKEGIFISTAHEIAGCENNLAIVLNDLESIQDFQDTSINNRKLVFVKVVDIDPIHDICILKCELSLTTKLNLVALDNISVGEEVSIFGYPHCNYGRMVLTQQNANVGAKILIERAGIKMKNIVLNIQSRPGQSGSPIIRNHEIVGMLVGSYVPAGGGGISLGGIDPQTLHQTTHAISSEYIMEMLK